MFTQATALLFPSLWPEPLSTAAYEAFQSYRPVLTSDAGGMKEIVRDLETGLVLPSGDAAAWEKAVIETARNRDLAASWGKAGRAWLEQNVSPAVFNERFSKILERASIRSVH